MKKSNKLLYGKGMNDADYKIYEVKFIDGKWKKLNCCPFYRTWSNMLRRCYSAKMHEKHPSYKDCSVCKDWLTFSNFKKWMEKQDWEGKQLDKDLLVLGNRVYRPDTCIFLTKKLNSFLIGFNLYDISTGHTFSKISDRYISQCNNPFEGKCKYLGSYNNPLDAHLRWLDYKIQLLDELNNSNHIPSHEIYQLLLRRCLTAKEDLKYDM